MDLFAGKVLRVVGFFEKVDAKLILFDIIILKKFSWKEVVLCQQ